MHQAKFFRVAIAGLGAMLFWGGLQHRPATSQSFDLGVFQTQALDQHNNHRSTHHSPDLTQGASLNATAQAYAETILSTGVFVHSKDHQRNGAGENMYYTISQFPLDPADLAERAVNAWYEEVAEYDYANPRFSPDTGHFTQVVWRSTTQLGCGVAQGPKTIAGRTVTANYVVCHYGPAGNNGNFPANVLQP